MEPHPARMAAAVSQGALPAAPTEDDGPICE
jgi:hypothetical protein